LRSRIGTDHRCKVIHSYVGKRIEMRNTYEEDERRQRRNETLRTANRTDATINIKARRGRRWDAT